MSQLTFSSFDASLMVREARGRYGADPAQDRRAQFMRYVHTKGKPVRDAAELVASRPRAITGARQS